MRNNIETFRLQCKAARALLEWNQERLAVAASVAKQTVADFERQARVPIRNNLNAIHSAFLTAGISFIEDEKGAGVRLENTDNSGVKK